MLKRCMTHWRFGNNLRSGQSGLRQGLGSVRVLVVGFGGSEKSVRKNMTFYSRVLQKFWHISGH